MPHCFPLASNCSSLLATAAMNTFLLSALCLLGAWAVLAEGVTVQDGDFSFPLESVKKLKALGELQERSMRSGRKRGGPALPGACSHLKFPEELRPLCKEPNAPEILGRLASIAQDPRSCEICAFAACAGC